ncbi:hypothetical protein F0562_023070 [Nyssa sinensis]|uniref:Uncharacterized protein n=1 Tax=Nyssa sinensis TaxID=561372 RepID=A0A5J5BH18_9ASTE|nr:hypothetical protein F0562_023070 [Nyssa sinensis]
MASSVDKETQSGPKDDVVSLELPAPPAWKKLFMPKKDTPRKNEIVSEFDWGTGETPRRSARISEKVKATPPSAESEPPKKRGRKSSGSKKDSKATEPVTEDSEGKKELEMQDAEVTEKENADADNTGTSENNRVESGCITQEEADKTNNADTKMDETGPEEVEKDFNIQTDTQETMNGEVEEAAVDIDKVGVTLVFQNEEEDVEDKQVMEKVEQPLTEGVKFKDASDKKLDQQGHVMEETDNGVGQEKEKLNGVAPASDGETKEQQVQENDVKYNLQVDEKDQKVAGEVMENGKINQGMRGDTPQHPSPAPVSC